MTTAGSGVVGAQTARRSRAARRVQAALVGVLVAYFVLPLVEPADAVLNSDWPSYATGGLLVLHDPVHLYDRPTQMRVEAGIVGGRRLANAEQGEYLSFDQSPPVALLAAGFVALGTTLGGRLWMIFELAVLVAGMVLAAAAVRRWRAGPGDDGVMPALPAVAAASTAIMVFNAQLDGIVVLGLGLAMYTYRRSPLLAGVCLTLALAKTQLVLPVVFGVVVFRQWRVLAGWAAGAAGAGLLVASLQASWLAEWPRFIVHGAGRLGYELSVTGLLLRSGLPGGVGYGLAAFAFAVLLGAVLWLAGRRREAPWVLIGGLVAAGFLLSPHSLSSDTVLLAFALLVSLRATAWQWWALSALAVAAAVLHASPVSSAIGLALGFGVLCLVLRPDISAVPT